MEGENHHPEVHLEPCRTTMLGLQLRLDSFTLDYELQSRLLI